jgi:HD-GYP domain-containing protein (c-di-GMP phosphodiesterase class II)
VADVFDALTSSRPYKPAWPMSRAIALLREGRGSHFDPHCVDALLHAWDERPRSAVALPGRRRARSAALPSRI